MTTGYKMKFKTIRVNSRKKAEAIIKALRNQGRHGFYDEFWDYGPGVEYHVHYWTRKGVI